jgi:hypothetical protein
MAVDITQYVAKQQVVACGYNQVWYEDLDMAAGTFVSLDGSNVLDTTQQIAMFEAYQKVFIANISLLYVADFTNEKYETGDIKPSGKQPPIKGALLTGSPSGATMVVDYITALDGAADVYAYRTSTTEFQSGDTVANAIASVSFTLTQPPVNRPHFYKWTVYGNATSIYGEMPTDAAIGVLYRGRAVLSGNKKYPYQWYMSRSANLYDWAYFATDALSPVAGNDADAGEMGDVIQALITYNDDYLIIGGAASIYIMRGDPAAGGSLDKLTDTTGIFGPNAYAWDAQRNLYFWGTQGIYRLTSDFRNLENISITTLPQLIKDEGANPETHRVTMGYDQVREGLVISVTTVATGANSNYWYDLRTQGFFPENYPVACAVYSNVFYDSNDKDLEGLLMGCTDGYVRVFDDDKKNDDQGPTDATIESHATIGPAAIGLDIDSRGRLKTLGITTGADTDSVDYGLYVKDTGEELVDAVTTSDVPHYFGVISDGNRIQQLRPRSRGAWIGLTLKNDTTDETWEFEKTIADIKPAGDIK